MTEETGFDLRRFRDCLSQFATGVTVVTMRNADRTRLGLTANSFSSVSLDPPLVLWSLNKESASFPAFQESGHYAINVLGADQMDLSNLFASRAEDKFAGVDTREGEFGSPLIEGAVAWFECRNEIMYEGGDHLIFVGHVERFDHAERPALLFVAGRYGVPARHPKAKMKAPAIPEAPDESRRFMDDGLMPLLIRATENVVTPYHAEMEDIGVPVAEARTYARVSQKDGITIEEIVETTTLDAAQVTANAERMESDGLLDVKRDGAMVRLGLTKAGWERHSQLMARQDRYEEEVLAGYGADEIDVLKSVLRTLIYRTRNND
jgi:3-hydroxy-9,10-secoandrosta-1,3,5(10)-triene-9,17-dione monooxygenase reductase component